MASETPSSPPTGERWGSRIGVIMAVAGSAVGLGNFLRFPGQAAQYGGGAFMIPYFISLLLLGIPLCWAEWTMGRYGGVRGFNSAPGIYRSVWRNPLAIYWGAIGLLVPLVIYMYYVVIEAWCLGYAINYLTGDLMIGTGGEIDRLLGEGSATDPKTVSSAFETFYNQFVGMGQNGSAMEGYGGQWLWVLVVVFALNFVLIYRGVNKGIEWLCRFAMPLMAILGIIVLIRVLTLGTPDPTHPERSVINGLNFMWNPDFQKLQNPATWLAAASQIFFTLGVGFGIIINYSSYLTRKDDVALSGLTSSSVNEFFEVCLGGLITIPAAFLFLDLTAGGGTYSTFTLGFKALPNVFDQMPGGRFFGFCWFMILFFAAITSSVAMLQPVIAFLEEGFGLKRHGSVAVLGLVSAFGGLVVLYFSQDLIALDTFDFWVGQVLIFLLAMFQAFLYGWVLGIERGDQEMHEGAHIRVPRFVQYVLKFVTPAYMLVIFGLFCFYNMPGYVETLLSKPVAVWSVVFIGLVALWLFLMVHIARKRWEREGRFTKIDQEHTALPQGDQP